MKIGKYYLVLAAVAVILCTPVFSVVEEPRRYEPVLHDKTDQLLAGIDKLCVVITQLDDEPNKNGLSRDELETGIINKLRRAGVNAAAGIAGDILEISELRVSIDMLKLEDLQQYVFHIQTSLARKVALPIKRHRYVKTDVWKTDAAMQQVPIGSMPAAVTRAVLEQVDTFIHAYLAANQFDTGVSDVNVASVTAATEHAWPDEQRYPTAYKYVASKNSNVFHRPDCSSAKRIKPENLVVYNSRQAAIAAGKRPCKLCKP